MVLREEGVQAMPPVRGLTPAPNDFLLSVIECENLVIICWFYVQKCTFEHMTDTFLQ